MTIRVTRQAFRFAKTWFPPGLRCWRIEILVKLATQDIDIHQAQQFEKRKIEALCYRGSLLDEDNLEGGMRILWDAMVAAGYLYEDGPRFLERDRPAQVQVRKKRDEKTVVIVTIFCYEDRGSPYLSWRFGMASAPTYLKLAPPLTINLPGC